jgi:lipid-A-disaccharide synthase
MKALIVAGEASGDLYGGALSSVLRQRIPSLQLAGMGGSRMADSGVQILYDSRSVSVVGVFEVFGKLVHLRQAFSRLCSSIETETPDFAILIDFPDFNFRLARILKKQHVPIFYFISPQIWAWRKRRIHFLRDHIKLMISILPFEKDLYEKAGVQVVYVGHPLVEMVQEELARQPSYPKSGKRLIGIMPGSRDVEVKRHLPVLTETIALIKKERDIENVLIWPPSLPASGFDVPSDISMIREDRYAAMQACDLLLVASGTSTLEAAILGTPLFIVYRVSALSWKLGKLLVQVPYYGLVNWIGGTKCIPEYMQSRMDPELLASDALRFLDDPAQQQKMKEQLKKIVDALGPPGAMERAADAIVAAL